MPILTPTTVEQLELAWAAGFFDGEGYVGGWWVKKCQRHKNMTYTIRVTICQAHPEVLERFQAAVGTGAIRGPFRRNPGNENWSDMWEFQTGVRGTVQIRDLLYPYLSSVKRAQFDKAVIPYLEHKKTEPARRSASQKAWRNS